MSIRDIKVRKNAVYSINKVISAMKMIAGIKMRRTKEKLNIAIEYDKNIFEIMKNSIVLNEDRFPFKAVNANNMTEANTSNKNEETTIQHIAKEIFIVISSEQGLCGSFNYQVLKFAKEKINKIDSETKEKNLNKKNADKKIDASKMWKVKKADGEPKYDTENQIVFCIGPKSIKKFHGEDVLTERPFSMSEISLIARRIYYMCKSGLASSCNIIYNKSKASAVSEQIFPIHFPKELHDYNAPSKAVNAQIQVTHDNRNSAHTEINHNNDLNTVSCDEICIFKIFSQIYCCLLESNTNEHNARMIYMDSAERNAVDMIKSLNKQYNEIRKASITRELVEITSASESLADN